MGEFITLDKRPIREIVEAIYQGFRDKLEKVSLERWQVIEDIELALYKFSTQRKEKLNDFDSESMLKLMIWAIYRLFLNIDKRSQDKVFGNYSWLWESTKKSEPIEQGLGLLDDLDEEQWRNNLKDNSKYLPPGGAL